jgi:hypothetical protein
MFWIQYEIKSVASLHDTRPAPAAAGMMISEAGQRELVEAHVPDLGYRATPVLPERGERQERKREVEVSDGDKCWSPRGFEHSSGACA